MHRRVNDVEVFLPVDDILVNHSLLYGAEIVIVHLTTDNLYDVLVALELHVIYCHLVNLVNDTLVMRSKHLCAIFPVSLVAVVLTRIVACSYVYASLTMELTDGKRNLRCWTESLEEINLYSVG